MLYTSYLSNLKGIREKYPSSIIIVVSRVNKIDLEKHKDVYWNIELAPSKELFSKNKNTNMSVDEFYIEYINEKIGDKTVYKTFNNIIDAAKTREVVLICYEKDYNGCHRKILAELIDKVSKNNIYKGEV